MFEPINNITKVTNPFKSEMNKLESGMVSFSELIKGAIDSANQKLKYSGEISRKVASGEVKDINQVVFAWQEAGLTLKMMRAITQKLIEGAKTLFQTNL